MKIQPDNCPRCNALWDDDLKLLTYWECKCGIWYHTGSDPCYSFEFIEPHPNQDIRHIIKWYDDGCIYFADSNLQKEFNLPLLDIHITFDDLKKILIWI